MKTIVSERLQQIAVISEARTHLEALLKDYLMLPFEPYLTKNIEHNQELNTFSAVYVLPSCGHRELLLLAFDVCRYRAERGLTETEKAIKSKAAQRKAVAKYKKKRRTIDRRRRNENKRDRQKRAAARKQKAANIKALKSLI